MKLNNKVLFLCASTLFAVFTSRAACIPDAIDSDGSCIGKPNCVEVKTKQRCEDEHTAKKKYFVDAAVETLTISDTANDTVTINGSKKWAFELTFFDENQNDITADLRRTGNLSDDCHGSQCRWVLRGGGLTKGQDIELKYTISRRAGVSEDIEALDPSVIIKR